MNKQNILRKKARKTKPICIRITPKHSDWMKKHNFSPTGILLEASKDLGYKER